ncbi:MAG: peptide-methionine (S)-S-oxide reductase MsrA [Oscillospiraceae bacterium]|jgi:methionine-S-sulfoxide reductase|nr:peptide-methionine (S)-S-oxide reductase MsrA [Oscillospiraceae bacterium]
MASIKTIHLAGGCFWGTEKYLGLIRGVILTRVGYANGTTENPTYEDVCRHGTGHAETVEAVYDAEILPLPQLLERFFLAIDPTAKDKQGHDVGSQYRTGVYWSSDEDEPIIAAALRTLQARRDAPIVVENEPLRCFYPAEDYHQKYLRKNPRGYCHIGQNLLDCAAQ